MEGVFKIFGTKKVLLYASRSIPIQSAVHPNNFDT